MERESARLDTFRRHGWPHADDHPRLAASILAREGLYRRGLDAKGDAVVCHRCRVRLFAWDGELDDPRVEHARYSPRCSFLSQLRRRAENEGANAEPTTPPTTTTAAADIASGNVEEEAREETEEEEEAAPEESRGRDVCGTGDVATSRRLESPESPRLMIPARHPRYLDRSARLASFPRFVARSSRNSDAGAVAAIVFRAYLCSRRESLADAGFFCLEETRVAGDDDLPDLDSLVVCYSCGVSLPYTTLVLDRSLPEVHARAQPECWHIVITRGRDFASSHADGTLK